MNTRLAYVSIITSKAYLEGLGAMYLSLLQTKTEIPLYCLIPNELYTSIEPLCKKLTDADMDGIRWITYAESIRIPEELIKKNDLQGDNRFNYTFDKLKIFELTQFDKIVYLDSDIYILQNLDHLFDCPHMSAMIAGASYPGNEDWVDLTSGIMTVQPQSHIIAEFEKVIPIVMQERQSCGDQDVLQKYYLDWVSRPELNFGEKYGIIAGYAEYYEKELEYHYDNNVNDKNSIAILHFAGESKPWFVHWSILSIIKQNLQLTALRIMHKRNTKCVLLEYKKLIREARRILYS